MKKILEIRAYMVKFYAEYSRYVNMALRFVLALLTFWFINDHVGYLKILGNPVVMIGLSVICVFLPMNMTVFLAALLVVVQLFVFSPGVALVTAAVMLIMFCLYFRYAPGNSVIFLVTPLAFTLNIPMLIPVVLGLLASPACAIPMACGIVIYYMITYVKSYATVIETMAEAGIVEQITSFTQQFLSNKEMWMIIISFIICILFVYNIRCLSIDYSHEIAIVGGILANLIMMTFGYVMMDVNVSYVSLIIGSVVVVFLGIVLKIFIFSVDYSRSDYLRFEDDEYYYYVKAVPKVSLEVEKKTVTTINVRQKTEMIDTDEVNNAMQDIKTDSLKGKLTSEISLEDSEIQKIIEQELNK